ncbi:BlaI/MecI/CopY family transcriptional regulator [Hamadaea sp. NPDC051192]|uniref:BlaI/MecI/CopY family transcriptional regulator n=1 Tax=Hamadaea sp. NPDC051192 TaxID=3154940 RepID=UPI00344132EC
MSDDRPRRGAGQREAEILAALWAAGTALTPARLVAALDGELAYSTVHAILSRLHDKGQIVKVGGIGRTRYAPAVDAATGAADRMRAVLDSVPDSREAVLARFVTRLSPADEAALRAALEQDPPS